MTPRIIADGIGQVREAFRAAYVGVKHGIFNAESGSNAVAEAALARIEELMQRHAAGHHLKHVGKRLSDGTFVTVDVHDCEHPATAFDLLGLRLQTDRGEQLTPQAVALQALIAIGRVPNWRQMPALQPLVEAANEWDLCRNVEGL